MRWTLILVLFAAACGAKSTPKPTPEPTPPPDPTAVECEAGACGPRLGMPTEQCADGSVGGNTGRCLKEPDGACGWEIRECPASAGDCVATGCNGTLCSDTPNDVVTTCEIKPEYACYRDAVCERQASGACGWTQTAELTACLAHPPAL
jgi:hypothetical protein